MTPSYYQRLLSIKLRTETKLYEQQLLFDLLRNHHCLIGAFSNCVKLSVMSFHGAFEAVKI